MALRHRRPYPEKPPLLRGAGIPEGICAGLPRTEKGEEQGGAGARHRGGEAPAHRHQGGIREGTEDDGGKGRADGAAPEEQGRPFGRPLAQEDEVPVRTRLRKDQVAYQDGLHHLHL